MITREFNLYLHAGHSIPLVINANQYDHGEQWLFKLFNSDGTQYVPSSGAIVGIKSDNLGIINSGSVDAQGRVVINETQQMTAAVGKAVFELVIDDGTHGTANFVVLVEPKPGDNADLSETDISMIEEAIEAASTIKPYGSPLVASTVAGMTDETKVYVYTGSETGYTSGHWYYYDGSDWADGGVYNSVAVQTDTTLTLSGVAADAKKTGDEISDLKGQIAQNSGVPKEVKQAMDTLFEHMAVSSGAGFEAEYLIIHDWASSTAKVTSISAVFDQSGAMITTDNTLNDLKQYLTVTASYSDGTREEVTSYTLSGTLASGTSTITVTYNGKTATFDVTVVGWTLEWDYTDGALPSSDEWTTTEGTGGIHTTTFVSGKGIKWTGSGWSFGYTPTEHTTTTEGIMEFVGNVENFGTNGSIRATLASETDCIIAFLTSEGIKVNSGTGELIADTVPSLNTDYTVRVERTATEGKIYLNGNLVYTGALRELAGTNNVMIAKSNLSGTMTAYIKSMRFMHIS